jgi:hypothetical protein
MDDDELSSDQSASLRAVIAQERVTVAWYKHLIGITPNGPVERRLRALCAYHQAQIKRRQKELKTWKR